MPTFAQLTRALSRRGRAAGLAIWLLSAWMGPDLRAVDPVAPHVGPMPAEQAFENLKRNAQVDWLVRLDVYDADPSRIQGGWTSLGGPHEDFTFVADYAELRGYTASEAIHKFGGSLAEGQRVRGVLFPIANHTIYPGSVRGLLQVVQQIDMRRAAEPGYHPAPLDVLLTDEERDNLRALALDSWAWYNYQEYFTAFAEAVKTLRREQASAMGYIGRSGHDWCEVGCTGSLSPGSPADEHPMTLELADGTRITIKNFGARVFLIRNMHLDALPEKRLLDFEDPQQQRIPYFALPSDAGPATPDGAGR